MPLKVAGAHCPSCQAMPTAEFAMLGKPPEWKCNACGARGALTGHFSREQKAPAPTPAPKIWHGKKVG